MYYDFLQSINNDTVLQLIHDVGAAVDRLFLTLWKRLQIVYSLLIFSSAFKMYATAWLTVTFIQSWSERIETGSAQFAMWEVAILYRDDMLACQYDCIKMEWE